MGNCQQKSQRKYHLVVQNAQGSASAAKKLISSNKIIQIGEPQILAYKDSNPFDGAIKVNEISKMHKMEIESW